MTPVVTVHWNAKQSHMMYRCLALLFHLKPIIRLPRTKGSCSLQNDAWRGQQTILKRQFGKAFSSTVMIIIHEIVVDFMLQQSLWMKFIVYFLSWMDNRQQGILDQIWHIWQFVKLNCEIFLQRLGVIYTLPWVHTEMFGAIRCLHVWVQFVTKKGTKEIVFPNCFLYLISRPNTMPVLESATVPTSLKNIFYFQGQMLHK